MNNKLIAGIATGAVGVTALFLGVSHDTEKYMIVPVEEMRAEYWEDANVDPENVIYTDQADAFIISFDENKIPKQLKHLESKDLEEMIAVKDDPNGEFAKVNEAQSFELEDDNYISE